LTVAPRQIVLFPGGGPTADAVRAFDQRHRLGEECSHWLALQALSLNAQFLARLLPEARLVSRLPAAGPGLVVADPYPIFLADEQRDESLPHLWHVTSDSLAARTAHI